jgi:exonuclease III
MDINNNHRNRIWNILCWNIRGLNSTGKWNSIKNKIKEKNCDMICLQETKRENFDRAYIKFFCPASFDCFEFVPSVGFSGGTLVCWKSSMFSGHVIFQNNFAQIPEFRSVVSGATWYLTNVYAPCTPEGKHNFLNWFQGIDMPDNVGDFNLIRKPEDRNKPGGSV